MIVLSSATGTVPEVAGVLSPPVEYMVAAMVVARVAIALYVRSVHGPALLQFLARLSMRGEEDGFTYMYSVYNSVSYAHIKTTPSSP
jgi:hypothetical protein